MPISLTSLERKLARLQDQAARALLLTSPYIITTCWGGQSNQDKREPGVTYIITDWGSPKLERREDQGDE